VAAWVESPRRQVFDPQTRRNPMRQQRSVFELHNFDQRHPVDRAVHEFFFARHTTLYSKFATAAEERSERLFEILLREIEARPDLKQSFSHQFGDPEFLEKVRADVRLLVRGEHVLAQVTAEANTLDLKLSLLAIALTTDPEKRILRSLGILPDDPRVHDPELLAVMLRPLNRAHTRAWMRQLVAKVLAKLRSLIPPRSNAEREE